MKLVQLPLCELVEDLEVYPRHAMDDSNVASLAMALQAGNTLPAIVAERKSKRIVDGWHRLRAYRRVLGPTGVIDVELQDYPDEKALLLDAIARNSIHGRRLDIIDQTRAIVMLQKHRVALVKIALALHVPEERIKKLQVRVATSATASGQTVPGTTIVTLKRPVLHLEGKELTEEQVKVHESLPGTSFLLVARQLKDALHADMVNLQDDKLVELLKELRDQLLTVFPL